MQIMIRQFHLTAERRTESELALDHTLPDLQPYKVHA